PLPDAPQREVPLLGGQAAKLGEQTALHRVELAVFDRAAIVVGEHQVPVVRPRDKLNRRQSKFLGNSKPFRTSAAWVAVGTVAPFTSPAHAKRGVTGLTGGGFPHHNPDLWRSYGVWLVSLHPAILKEVTRMGRGKGQGPTLDVRPLVQHLGW